MQRATVRLIVTRAVITISSRHLNFLGDLIMLLVPDGPLGVLAGDPLPFPDDDGMEDGLLVIPPRDP